MSLHHKVYDISRYLDDHPGGSEVLLDLAGKDGTEECEDVGHSKAARAELSQFEVGEITPTERTVAKADADAAGAGAGAGAMMGLPVLMAAVAAGYYCYSR